LHGIETRIVDIIRSAVRQDHSVGQLTAIAFGRLFPLGSLP
jgi:hypothetical protein